MLGKRTDQRGMFEADQMYLDYVGRDNFYGFLASQRGQLFRDEEFAKLYVLDNGRPSVPPSLLATALLLQTYDGVSDEEARDRAAYDMRWKVALGISLEEQPYAKSTLQLFRAQLVLNDGLQAVFKKSLQFAQQSGYLKTRKIKVALDTSNILGRGAVKDTYNLLADGIVKLGRELADLAHTTTEAWAKEHKLGRYFEGSSLKGEAGVDWEDPKQRQALLAGIVADADRLLEMARGAIESYDEDSEEGQRVKEAADLLSQLLLQDVERTPAGVSIKDGVAKDRIVSVHDPEMRHGHKSKSKLFDGHKLAVAVETDDGLITAATVLAGNAADKEEALGLVEQSEANTEVEVEETIGDCAYGDGETRQEFADAGRDLVAKVPAQTNGEHFGKVDFQIDPVAKTCTCPAGHICPAPTKVGRHKGKNGERQAAYRFQFEHELCDACPLRSRCVRAKPGQGRTVSLHPQEALLQKARAFQKSEAFASYRKRRQVVEHRIARLMQLGMRQARYFGRAKTLGQLLLAAMVANLTLVATKIGLMGGQNKGNKAAIFLCSQIQSLINEFWEEIWAVGSYWLDLAYIRRCSTAGCRLGF
jgi:transposase